MTILTDIISAVCSTLLAYLGTCFQKSYIQQQKFTFAQVLPKESAYFVISLICYTAFLIMGNHVYSQKEITFVQMVETVFFWYGLFLISWTDLKIKKIPNVILKILFIIKLFGIILEVLIDLQSWKIAILSSIMGMLIAGISILLCMVISRGQIGAGDVKLYALTGLYLGIVGFFNIIIYSVFIAGIFSIITLIINRIKYGKKLSESIKSTIPMAPFIFLGVTLYLIFL